MGRVAILAVCLVIVGGAPLHAESAFDIVFRSGTLDGLPEGTRLHYDSDAAPQEGWRELVVGLGPGDEARVEGVPGEGGSAERVLGSFPAGVGNPVAMVFLEDTVTAISEATGGSPFYIRNRIRDALGGPGEVAEVTVPWGGATIPATEVALAPFANDAHRAELGGFADLEIRVVVSEAVPGWYVSMAATAPAASAGADYATSLSLAGVEP